MKTHFAFTLALLALACSSGDDDEFTANVCAAGKTQACACESGDTGAQKCNKDGKAWGECMCEPGMGTPGGDCATDEDCVEKAAPYCVAKECVAPVIAPGGAACPHGTDCADGFFCDEGNHCVAL